MLTIPEDFLKEEEREGFLVPELMKRSWAAELLMLDELREFFGKHGLTWFAEMGTMLGAVRHRGFIPWDDDIDIGMPRPDYMKLQELAANGQLPEPLRLKSFYLQDEFDQLHSVLSNSRADRLEWDEDRMERYCGCPFIVSIDIFPFDYIQRDPQLAKLQKLLYNMAHVMAFSYDSVFGSERNPEREQKYETDLHTLEQYCQIVLDYDAPVKPQLFRLADKIAMQCQESNAEFFDYFPRRVIDVDLPLRRMEWYRTLIMQPFEMTEVPVPHRWEETLVTIYHENWQTPRRGSAEHGYPFYASQLEYFKLSGHSL